VLVVENAVADSLMITFAVKVSVLYNASERRRRRRDKLFLLKQRRVVAGFGSLYNI